MLRTTRLQPGQRALLPHPQPPTSTGTTTISARPVTFAAKGNIRRPITLTGTTGGMPKPNPSAPRRFFARPPSAWSPSTISTIALGSMLGGSWYVWEEGRSYMVADKADRYEPRSLGTHREGKVNRDYTNYEQWIETHGKKK